MARFKLNFIKDAISGILKRWNEESAQKFLEKAKDGTYSEAENDAILLRQLLKNEQDLLELIKKIEEQ
ncbi:MAG: hypothetical protein EU530_10840 [Promethearchaeota archaeon]|nr:MAG: hypothetical protein EU530_10840 [Candidatus Lokiarchaeota archaeon]